MKTMNQLQKLEMKFLRDKKKLFLTFLLLFFADAIVFAQTKSIIPSDGLTL